MTSAPPDPTASPTAKRSRSRAAPRWQHFAANRAGRDFVVGDLHGCLSMLHEALACVGFSTTTDRLFSVGDLVDRGPDSLGCLQLLRERCFHAVLGNHGQMMLDWLAGRQDGPDWFANGGRWILEHRDSPDREEIEALAVKVARLPLMISVDLRDGTRFHVIHAELPEGAAESEEQLRQRAHLNRVLDARDDWGELSVTWERRLFEPAAFAALDARMLARLRARRSAVAEPGPTDAPVPRIYSGHTVVQAPLRIGNLVNIDTGAFLAARGRDEWAGLTLTEPLTGRCWTAGRDAVRETAPVMV